MSAKRSKIAISSSAAIIRKASRALDKSTDLEQIAVMVKAGVMTEEGADRARQKLAEIAEAEAAAAGPAAEGGPRGDGVGASIPQAG